MRKKTEKVLCQILSGAKKTIALKGYAETTISDVARAAGVSPVTIYNYFESKQELFNKLGLDGSYMDYQPSKDKKRDQIIQTALIMFGEKGYNGTTMEAIARRLDMGKSTIYQYFDNKAALFASVLAESKVNLKAKSILAEPDHLDWKQMLMEMGQAYLDMGNDPLREAIFKTVIQQSSSNPEFGHLYHTNGKSATSGDLASYLKKFQEQGLIRADLDLKLTSFLYLCILWGYNISFKYIKGNEREFSEEDVLRHATEMILNGIRTDDDRANEK